MEYQKEKFLGQIAKFAITLIIFLVMLMIFIASISEGTSGAWIFLLPLGYSGLLAWAHGKALCEAKAELDKQKKDNPLAHLEDVDKYKNQAEMCKAMQEQKEYKIYEDDELFITEEFLVVKSMPSYPFLLNGILDVKPYMNRVNGVVDKIGIMILYYDGYKQDFRYDKSLGDDMNYKWEGIKVASNIIANKSKNYKKASL